MILLKTWGIAALIAAGVVTVLIQRQSRASIQTEIASLEAHAADVARARQQQRDLIARQPTASELESLRNQHTELLRLRAELASLPPAATETAAPYPVTVTGSIFNPKRVGTADLKLKDQWRNVGNATPADSFETFCWADRVGDIDVLVAMMLMSPEARLKAQEIFNGMSPDSRVKFGTPERLVAMLSIGAGTPFEGIKVLGAHERAPGEVVLNTLWQYGDGRLRENTNVILRQTDSGWQRPVSAQQIEQLYHLRMSAPSGSANPPKP
jgi:hypothetical protein